MKHVNWSPQQWDHSPGPGLALRSAGQRLPLFWRQVGEGTSAPTRTPRERAYAVETATLEAVTVTPIVTSYGRLESGRTLELRAALAGSLVELSDTFLNGGTVARDELLYRIDPSKLETALALAETDVTEAEAAQAETRSALELAKLEADAARQQLELRDQTLARQADLRDRGVATEADLEAATFARVAANQTLINRQQVVAGDAARVAQAEIALSRRQIALAEARRTLDETSVTAPFAGVLAEVTAVPGRLVSPGEQLAVLIDPSDIEVAFRITSNQYARLLNERGELRKSEMVVEIQRGRQVTELTATLARASTEIAQDKVGRLVYAKLVDPDPSFVQPGDFVTVRIPERPMEGVVVIPATAATTDGRILLIGEGNRLE